MLLLKHDRSPSKANVLELLKDQMGLHLPVPMLALDDSCRLVLLARVWHWACLFPLIALVLKPPLDLLLR